MADTCPPQIFSGAYHKDAMARVRGQFEAPYFGEVADLLTATINHFVARAKGATKCGADLYGLQASRAVFDALAGRVVGEVDTQSWLMVTRSRALAALDARSSEALYAPAASILAGQRDTWRWAARIAREAGLFRPDPKARRSKIKLSKAKPRPAPEHLEANL